MINENILKELKEEEKRIVNDINILGDDLKAIRLVIDRHEKQKSANNGSPLNQERARITEPLKLTAAIKYILSTNPEREFTAVQMRDELERMKERGEFITDSDNYLPTVHSTLNSLYDRELVRRRKLGGKAYFAHIKEE